MAWTQSDLDRIEAAIASVTLSVSFQDRTITYRSMDDLRAARAEIKASLASSGSGPKPVRQVRLSGSKGF